MREAGLGCLLIIGIVVALAIYHGRNDGRQKKPAPADRSGTPATGQQESPPPIPSTGTGAGEAKVWPLERQTNPEWYVGGFVEVPLPAAIVSPLSPARTWSAKSGDSLHGSYISTAADFTLRFVGSNGRHYTIPNAKLSNEDRQWLVARCDEHMQYVGPPPPLEPRKPQPESAGPLKKVDGSSTTGSGPATPARKPEGDHPTHSQKRAPVAGEFRTWTDASGQFTIDAEFKGMVYRGVKAVKLSKRNGDEVIVPLDKLSGEDRAWIQSRR
jgi:hypothetical protein